MALLHDISTAGMGGQVILGAAWVFASAVTYALYYLGTGVMLKRLGSMRLAGLAGSASALMVLVLRRLDRHGPAAGGGMALCGAHGAVLHRSANLLDGAGHSANGPNHTAAVGNLGPVLTILASWALLNEAISLYQLAGLALVLVGVSQLKPAAPSQANAVDGGVPEAGSAPGRRGFV